jgi:hypothetical protein
MEPTGQLSELTQAASGFLQANGWILYLLVGTLILVVVYYLYQSFQPSKNKALSKAKPKFQTYEQVTKLAPLGCPTPANFKLCDYYIASSSYSVFPGAEVYDYVSDQILPLIIKAGARLVELDIYADTNDKPVVGLKNQKLGTDYAYNTVPFEACCVSIVNNAFNSIHCPVSSDPFLLSLNFHTDKTNVINAAAEILKTTCRANLLDETYAYQRKNLAVEPICNLQSKIVIISGGSMKGTVMEELVNLSWDTSHLRRLTYQQASQPHDADELVNFNRTHMTMVVPDITEDLVNNNPQILFTYGCQLIMMNYGSIDDMMELYIGEFQENSCVLKPAPLRPLKPKKYKKPTLPDPSVSFQPMQKISPIYNITV